MLVRPVVVSVLRYRPGAVDLGSRSTQLREGPSRLGVAPLLRARKGFFGFGDSVVCGEQQRELERGIGDAAIIGPAVGRRSAGDVAAFLEQHREVVSGARMPALVRAR